MDCPCPIAVPCGQQIFFFYEKTNHSVAKDNKISLFFKAVIGQRLGLSAIDARQANLLYRSQCGM